MIGWIDIVMRLSRRQLEPATELKRAITACDISVHYQPVMDLRTSKCVGAEALARWQASDGHWISPNVFIPIAEKAGLVQDLTLCVMHIVVRDLKAIYKDVGSTSVNLNLSPDDLQTDRVAHEPRVAALECGRAVADDELPGLELDQRACAGGVSVDDHDDAEHLCLCGL